MTASKQRSIRSSITFVAMVVVVICIIRGFVGQVFWIPSGSMLPTLKKHDRVLVEKISYRLHDIERGDVVVFSEPLDRAASSEEETMTASGEDHLIKRVVAVAGDVVSYDAVDERLVVNGEVVQEGFVFGGPGSWKQSLNGSKCDRLRMDIVGDSCVVPEGTVFVMGDNRVNSLDSRFIGPVPLEAIVGRAIAVVWPPSHARSL